MKKLSQLIPIILCMLIVPFILSGCNKNEQDNFNAYVTLINASPNGPRVNILQNSVQLNNAPVIYPGWSGYFTTYAGDQTINVRKKDETTNFASFTQYYKRDGHYSVFIVDSASKLGAIIVEDDLMYPDSGMAKIRFAHMVPNGPAVDLGYDGGATVFANKNFKDVSPFIQVPKGSVNLELRLAGTGTVVYDLAPISVVAGKSYTIEVRGFAGSPTYPLSSIVFVNR